jgi:hypothetical protein
LVWVMLSPLSYGLGARIQVLPGKVRPLRLDTSDEQSIVNVYGIHKSEHHARRRRVCLEAKRENKATRATRAAFCP